MPPYASTTAKLAKSIASQVRAWREEGGCDQGWLSKKTSMKQSSISRIESGKHLPTLRSLGRLAKAFNADVVVAIVRKDRSPLDGELIERMAAAMVDCHEASPHHANWAWWVAQASDTTAAPYEREMAQEWVAARRKEAAAALLALNSISESEKR